MREARGPSRGVRQTQRRGECPFSEAEGSALRGPQETSSLGPPALIRGARTPARLPPAAGINRFWGSMARELPSSLLNGLRTRRLRFTGHLLRADTLDGAGSTPPRTDLTLFKGRPVCLSRCISTASLPLRTQLLASLCIEAVSPQLLVTFCAPHRSVTLPAGVLFPRSHGHSFLLGANSLPLGVLVKSPPWDLRFAGAGTTAGPADGRHAGAQHGA